MDTLKQIIEAQKVVNPRFDHDEYKESLASSKAATLVQRKDEKLNRLSPDISNYEDIGYTGTQEKHGELINASGVHDFNNQEEVFWDMVRDQSVHESIEDPTKKVTLQPNYDDPTLIGPQSRDQFKETEVHRNKYGQYDTRGGYLEYIEGDPTTTEDDIGKFGLNRTDLNEEAIARGMSPSDARYSNQKEFWPYKGPRYSRSGKDRAYDGTPGKMVDDAAGRETLWNMEFLNDPVTQFELNRYMDKDTIRARVMDPSLPKEERERLYELLGGGGSEYTYADKDPLMNPNYDKTSSEIGDDVVTPTIPKGYSKEGENVGYSDIDTTILEDVAGGISRLGNAAQSAMSTVAGTGYGILDAGSELLGTATGGHVGGDLATDKEITEWADELTGYDDKYTTKAAEEIKDSYRQYQKDGDLLKLIKDGGWAGLGAAPEAAASSLAFVAMLFAPGKVLQGVSKLGKAIRVETAGMNAANKAAKTKEIMNKAGTLGKVMHAVKGQAGFIGVSASDTSSDMDAYKEEHDEDMSVGRVIGSMTINMVKNNLDGFIDKKIITAEGIGSKQVLGLIAGASDGAKTKLSKELVAKGFGVAADIILKEVPTEIIQAGAEAVSKKYKVGGDESVGDILTSQDTQEDMAVSALMTPGSVAGMKAYGAVPTGLDRLKRDKVDTTTDTQGVEDSVDTTERKANLKEELGGIHDKVVETQDSTNEDIARMQEIVSELSMDATVSDEAKEQLKVFAEDVKQHRIKQITKNELVLGSKEDLISVLDDIITDDAELDEATDNKLFELASKAGVLDGETVAAKKESYKKIKKDFYSVGVEATTGKRGYITYGNELRSLTNATVPDEKTITKKVKQLLKFEESQEAYVKGLSTLVDQVEKDINTYNNDTSSHKDSMLSADKIINKYRNNIKIPGTNKSEWKFNLAIDGDGKIINNSAKAVKAVIAESKANIHGIQAELSKSMPKLVSLGIDTDAIGISTKPIIDTTGKYKKPLEAVKKDIESLTRYMSDKGSVKYITELKDDGFTSALTKNDAEKVNSLDYTADDIVYIVFDTPQNAADVKAIRKQFATNGKLHNTIKAAKEAGATIVANTNPLSKDTNVANLHKLVVQNLTRFAGPRYLSIGTSEGTASTRRVFKPKAVVTENRAKQKEAVAKKKLHKDRLDKLYEHYEVGGEATSELKEMRIEVLKEFDNETKYESYIANRLKGRIAEALKEWKGLVSLDEKAVAEDAWNAEYGEVVRTKAKEQYDKYVDRKESNKGYITQIKNLKEELARLTVEEDINGVHTQIEELIAELSSDDPRTLTEKMLEESSSKGMGSIYVSTKGEPTKSESTVGKIKSAHKKRAEGKELGETNKKWVNHKQQPLDVNSYVTTDKDPNILTILEPEMLLGEEHKGYHRGMFEWLKGSQKLGTPEPETGKSYSQADLDMKDSSALGLVLDTEGNVNETVALAMQLAIDEVITFNGSALNPEFKSKEDAARMIGILEPQLTKEMYRFLKSKGSFNKTVAYDVGKATAAKLGLKYKKDAKQVEKEAFDKLLVDIGNMAIMGAESQDQLTTSEAPASEFTKAKGDTKLGEDYVDGTSEKATIWFVQTPEKKDGETDPTAEYKKIHEAIDEASVFEKKYHTKPIKNPRFEKEGVAKDIIGLQIPSKGTNSPLKLLKKLVKMKWQPDETGIRDVVEMDRDVLLKYQGYKTEDQLSKMTVDGRAAAESKNREIEKSINELEKLGTEAAKTGDRFTMYFDWFYSGNGRYMMDSNTISPQTDKLHRFIIQPISHMKKYVVKDKEVVLGKKNVTKKINYALAQAFGYAVDKKSSEKIQLVGDTLRNLDKNQLTELGKMVKEGDIEGLEGFLPSVMNEKQLKSLGKDTKLEVEHISHTLQGLRTLEGLIVDGKVTTALTAEFDAVTSGFGLKLLQLPILKDMWKWLNKVGIFRKGDMQDATSMNDWLDADDNLDSYQALGEEADVKTMDITFSTDPNNPSNTKYIEKHAAKKKQLWSIMSDQELLKKLDDDGSVSKALRTLFKDPFMTFNYSAGIKSIKESLANKLTNEVLEGIAQEDSKYDKLKDKIAKMSGRSPEELVTDLRTKPLGGIRVGKGKNTKAIDVLLVEMYTTTYGAKVEQIMTDNFSEFMEANDTINGAFRVMFDVFNTKYQEAVSKIPVGDMNDDKKMEILYGKDSKDGEIMEDGLLKQFPLIKGPFSDTEQEGIGIYTTKSQTLDDDTTRYMPATTKTGIDKEGKRTKKVRHPIRAFEAAISAGSVVPIHYIDGGLMAQLQGFDFTAIHDAVMPELDKSDEIVEKYNEAMIKVNGQYKLVIAIQDMLKNIDKVEADKTKISIRVWKDGVSEWTNTDNSTITNGEILGRIDELVKRVKKGAKDIEELVHKVGHMAGMEDGMWTNPTSEVQEEVKPEEGTIADKEKLLDVLGGITTKAGEVTPYVAKIIKLIEDC